MNYRLIFFYLGRILQIVCVFLVLPFLVGLIYGEYTHLWSILVTMAVYLAVGFAMTFRFGKKRDRKLRNREALVIVGLCWVFVSLIGALPFVLDGCIPNYIDALFETISGFTTTGATILDEPSVLPRCMLFWRSFTHWLGGMGILVFILAVMPGTDGSTFHLFKFESPGPQVGKLTSKVRHTATILYLIYFVLTVIEMLFLLPKVGVFEAILTAMSTAGTGGFASTGASIAAFDSLYVEIVVMVFMFLFSLNFNVYYLIVLRHWKLAFTDEELIFYVTYVVGAILAIACNLIPYYGGDFWTALRYSSFSVLSLTSSTGFATADFGQWPKLAQSMLYVCMFFGACAGSTGGGFKASRIVILIKSAYKHLLQVLNPHRVQCVKMNGKPLEKEESDGVVQYFLIYVMIFIVALVLLSAEKTGSFSQTFSSTLSCLNNDGPYMTNAFGGYGDCSVFSKIIYMFLMLIGRLEIFPFLLLFVRGTWRKIQ